MKHTAYSQNGAVSGSLIAIIALIVTTLTFGSLAVWAYVNYNEQKTNVDGKIALAVAEARQVQAVELEEKFFERENALEREFVGPDNHGRLTFTYPKTWSVYVARDGSSGNYEAYLHPVTVPTVSNNEQFAVRVTIEDRAYDTVLRSYESRIRSGELRSSATSSNGHTGTRIDGNFSNNIRGSAVVYQIRDKTLTVRTDADTFRPLYDKLISTIDFNA